MEIKRRVPTEVTSKVDVYSYGIILWEILTRKDAFSHHKNYALFARSVQAGERPPIPTDCPWDLRDLMCKCWAREPTERPSFREIAKELEAIIERLKRQEQEDAVARLVEDRDGRALWVESFLGRTSVSWNEFADAILPVIDALAVKAYGSAVAVAEADVAAQCLRAVLGTPCPVRLCS